MRATCALAFALALSFAFASALPLAASAFNDLAEGGLVETKPADENDYIQRFAAEAGLEIDTQTEQQGGYDYKAIADSLPGTPYTKLEWWEKDFIIEEYQLGKFIVLVPDKDGEDDVLKDNGQVVQIKRKNKMCDERRWDCDPGKGIVITGKNIKTGEPFVMNTFVEKWDGQVTFDMQKINGDDADWTTPWNGNGYDFPDGSRWLYSGPLEDDYYTRGFTEFPKW